MRPKYRILREEPAAGSTEPGTEGGGAPAVAIPPAEKNWLDDAPEDVKEILKTNKTLTKFKSPWEAAKGYVNLEKVYSGSIKMPGETATDEERREFNKKIGVPDDPAGYGTVKENKLLPEGMAWDEESEVAARGELHKLGLTPMQYKGVMALYIKTAQGGGDALAELMATQSRASLAELQTKWGANMRRNLALAGRTAAEYGGPEFTRLLDTPIPGLGADGKPGRLGDHPAYLRFAAQIGNAMLEDGLVTGTDLTTDKNTAESELSKVMNDKAHPYWKRGPGHDEAVARVRQLHQIISGEM